MCNPGPGLKQHLKYFFSSLMQSYLEAFYKFCEKQGGTTAEIMRPILEVRNIQSLYTKVLHNVVIIVSLCFFCSVSLHLQKYL